MKPHHYLLSMLFFLLLWQTGWAQESTYYTPGVDTTSRGYQIGRKIGSWLPFILFGGLAIFYILRAYRFKKKEDN